MKTENYLTLSALDLKSLLTRVDVLFYWNHWNPYLSNFLGKRKLVPKIGVWEIRGKITVFDWREETTFGSSYLEVQKILRVREIRIPLYCIFNLSPIWYTLNTILYSWLIIIIIIIIIIIRLCFTTLATHNKSWFPGGV